MKVAGQVALGSVLGGVIVRVSAGGFTVTEVDVVTWLPAVSSPADDNEAACRAVERATR